MPESRRIRVLIFSPSAFARKAMRRVLQSNPAFELAGETRSTRQTEAESVRVHPDTVLIDAGKPSFRILGAVRKMRADNAKMLIVIFNASENTDLITLFQRAGASTCLPGPAGPLSLLNVLRSAAPPQQATSERLFERVQERTALNPALPFHTGSISQSQLRGDR